MNTLGDRSSSPRQWSRFASCIGCDQRPATSGSPSCRRQADGRAHADCGPSGCVLPAPPQISDSGGLTGGNPALKPGRYAIASLHNGVRNSSGPGIPDVLHGASRWSETPRWSGRPRRWRPRNAVPVRLALTTGSRTRVPTTPPSSKAGSGAGGLLVIARQPGSTRGRSTAPP